MMTIVLEKSASRPGGIGQPAVAQNLKQQIEETAVRPSRTHRTDRTENGCSRTLAVSRPSAPNAAADQALDRGGAGELAHVKAGEAVAIAEEILGQRLGHLGFADAGRARRTAAKRSAGAGASATP